jgi:uncharacterized protein
MIARRAALIGLLSLPLQVKGALADAERIPAEPWAQNLIAAAEAQIGVTLSYDPAYRRIQFPGGDVPRASGVCTDVIIRAYRAAFGFDLQQAVNADMKRNFSAYPNNWGLSRTDSNIDHRRVPNLRTFFRRKGAELRLGLGAADFLPGDVVTQNLPGNLAHIGLVSNRLNIGQSRPLVIHNIGGGAQIEDTLFAFEITGRYRFPA